MAKRSVKRARERTRAATPESPPPPRTSAPSSRQFWLGALAAACLLVPVAIVAVVLAAREDNAQAPTTSAAVTPDASAQAEAERLQEIAQTRDKNQVQDLTSQMRLLSEDLDPVLQGVAKTLPPDDAKRIRSLAGQRDVDAWVRTTRDAEQAFAEAPSGDTGTNVARGTLAAAVRGFAEMMRTYELAVDRRQDRRVLLERARAQRDNAMSAWETAAIQIDVINIAAGFGHQHPPAPGVGGAPPDDLAEGTGATDGG